MLRIGGSAEGAQYSIAKGALSYFLLVVLAVQFLFGSQAFACATCGLGQSFTPKIFFLSLGFVILPLAFVGSIAWRLWRESRNDG